MIQRIQTLVLTLGIVLALLGMRPALAQMHGVPPGTVTLDTATTVPFTLAAGLIYITAKVNGHPFAFVFDTGGQAAITREVQAALHLSVVGQANFGGAGDSKPSTDLVHLDRFDIGKAQYKGATAIVLPSGFPHTNPLHGVSYGGTIGREFFRQLVTTINYEKRTLSFAQPGAFKPNPAAISLPLTMRFGVFPNVLASIDGHPGTFDLDAGSIGAVTLTQAFAQRNGLGNSGRVLNVDIGRGIGGYIVGTASRGEDLSLGNVHVPKPLVMVAHSNAGYFADPNPDFGGNIGTQVLQRFVVTIDVPASRVYLVPNVQLSAPFPFNRSGITARSQAGLVAVISVAPQSPAAEAGVAAGDIITAIDGKALHPSTSALEMNGMWLRPAGTAVALTLRRNGTPVSVTMKLRDLL